MLYWNSGNWWVSFSVRQCYCDGLSQTLQAPWSEILKLFYIRNQIKQYFYIMFPLLGFFMIILLFCVCDASLQYSFFNCFKRFQTYLHACLLLLMTAHQLLFYWQPLCSGLVAKALLIFLIYCSDCIIFLQKFYCAFKPKVLDNLWHIPKGWSSTREFFL